VNFIEYLFELPRPPDKNAILMGGTKVTYGALLERIKAVSAHLQASGQTQNAIIFADNSPFVVESYIGTMAAGHVAIPLFPRISKKDLEYIIKSSKARTAFVQKKYLKDFAAIEGSAIEQVFTDEPVEGHPTLASLPAKDASFKEIPDKDHLAVIVFTSGSTGVPKGAMISHGNLMANTSSILEYIKLAPDDRIMCVLPFSYCYGASLLHTHVRVGGELVINNRFMFPGKVLEEINEKACTGFAGVPSHFQILLRRTKMKEMAFPSLRYVAQAGGKLPTPFITELMNALPKTKIFIMYGQTEATARLSYLPPELLKTKLGSMGKGIPGVKLEVLDKDGKPVKPGDVGEIVASGENIMKGYWNDPEETKKVLRGGKLYTGDLATVDKDGYIFVVEREKQIIKSGGYRVSPKEIEDVIVAIPDVVEAAVIGVPDDLLGEAIKAFVTVTDPRHPKITKDDIVKACNKVFPAYKVPRHVEFIDAIPKNSYGKVMKEELKKREAKP